MQIRLISDIHLEFARSPDLQSRIVPELDTDSETVLIVAGDFAAFPLYSDIIYYLSKWAKRFKHVIYIAGNHEYYKSNLENVDSLYSAIPSRMEIDNLTYLNRSSIVIDDVEFVGATLWTDYMRETNQYTQDQIGWCLNDYRFISDFTQHRQNAENEKDEAYILDRIINCNHSQKQVIVTHHAPSTMSTHWRFKNDIINPAFANQALADKLRNIWYDTNRLPVLWVHGHMHDATDHEINGMRVVANPFGYKTEKQSNGYDPVKIIEI